MKRSIRLQLLQDEMKRKREAERLSTNDNVHGYGLTGQVTSQSATTPTRPKCTNKDCHRFARKGSVLCSRCTFKNVESKLRDTLPGLETESQASVGNTYHDKGCPCGFCKAGFTRFTELPVIDKTSKEIIDVASAVLAAQPPIPGTMIDVSKGYYTRKQVSALLGVSPTSICRWEQKGKTPLPKRQVYNNQLVYTEAHVQLLKEFMSQQTTVEMTPVPERQRAKAANGVAKKTFKLSKGLERTVASRLGRMSLVSGKLM